MSALIFHRLTERLYVYLFKLSLIIVLLFSLPALLYAHNVGYTEIHCKHFFYGYPTGTLSTNDLIIRDIYAMSTNDDTKFADWVAFRLDRKTMDRKVKTKRTWKADPWLDGRETLEPPDYKKAFTTLKVDRGHQAPLASFKGSDDWHETNYLSNITPQKSNLNQGPWRILEDRVRNLVTSGRVVYVMTGPLYERDMPALPGADEPHRVPSGYWKIIALQTGKSLDSIKTAGFIFDQNTGRSEKIISRLCSIDVIEAKTGLDFLREVPDDQEERIERGVDKKWAEMHFLN